jgi:hypothetical protein
MVHSLVQIHLLFPRLRRRIWCIQKALPITMAVRAAYWFNVSLVGGLSSDVAEVS